LSGDLIIQVPKVPRNPVRVTRVEEATLLRLPTDAEGLLLDLDNAAVGVHVRQYKRSAVRMQAHLLLELVGGV
jgi:hypothetical protein